MTLPTIPLWAATSADLATLSDHGVVMLAAMLSTELRPWRTTSTRDLHVMRNNVRDVALGGGGTLLGWATTHREALGTALAHRVLYRRAIDEASRRGLVPDDADLRVSIDAALAAGRIDPEHLPVTLAEVWAACTMLGAEGHLATGEVKAWLASASRLPGKYFDIRITADTSGLPAALATASGGLSAAIVEAGAQAERTAAEMREGVNMTAAEMREWAQTFDCVPAPPPVEIVETDRPHAPPIGRGLERRLGRGRRRYR